MKTKRVLNFGAGPGAIPESVLSEAQEELLSWDDMGVSVLEISHRHKRFIELVETSQAKMRQLLKVPESFEILFMAGPTRAQFSAIPMNLLQANQSAYYIDSGIWSHMALQEAVQLNYSVKSISSRDAHYKTLPNLSALPDVQACQFLHYCDNETVNGVEFPANSPFPDIPRAVDMTSNIFTREIDFDNTAIIYAGAQKNFGASGLTAVIIKGSLLDKSPNTIPSFLNYRLQHDNQSLYYTPTTFSVYIADKVFEWLLNEGGVSEMSRRAERRSSLLYAYIDVEPFYSNDVAHDCRSRMNIPFKLADENLNETFLRAAESAGLFALNGHRFVGGMRASLYNAMPVSGVETLIDFMKLFVKQHG